MISFALDLLSEIVDVGNWSEAAFLGRLAIAAALSAPLVGFAWRCVSGAESLKRGGSHVRTVL